jgi:hypothetical protein
MPSETLTETHYLKGFGAEKPTLAQNVSGRHIRAITPKEFAGALGGLVTADWVREQCSKGRIKLLKEGAPYHIDPAELVRYRPPLESLGIIV